MLAGIDEAGRGPVIGPMVIVGIKSEQEPLVLLNVKDSKKLSKKRRESLFQDIISVIDDYTVKIISPNEIDLTLENENSNLNLLEVKYISDIILELKPMKVYIDCPYSNPMSFFQEIKRYLDQVFNKEGKIINAEERFLYYEDLIIVAEHKADEKYPVVSAASIIAKVIRDREIEKIKQEIGIDFGSGYPSDPKTIEFLKEHGKNFTKYIRKSWQTWKLIQDKEKQNTLNNYFKI